MEFTDRITQDQESSACCWYYDVKYGQDRTILKISALVCVPIVLMGFLMPLFSPGGMNPWESGGITLGVGIFVILVAWAVDALMYKMQGGKTRLCFVLDRYELTVMSDLRIAKGMKAMGATVAAAGLLAGSASGLLTGAGMVGFSQKAVVRLEKTWRIILRPKKDMIVLWVGLKYCQVYVPAEDFDTLKKFLLACTQRSATVVQK